METGPFLAGLAAIWSEELDVDTCCDTTLPVNAEGATKAHAEATEVNATAISIFMLRVGWYSGSSTRERDRM